MDSTLALGAFRIARGAGGEGVDVNGNLVEREKHHLNLHLNLGVGCAPSCWPIFGFRNLLGARRGAEGSFLCSPSSRFSSRRGRGGEPPQGMTGELGCQGAAGAKKNCEIGVGFSFADLSVFRLRRAEAASALWIPHWHSEPCESQGARAAKGWT